MTIRDTIHEDMISAWKNGNLTRKTILSTLLSSLQNEEKQGKHPHEYSDDEIIGFLKTQVRQRVKSAEEYDKVGSRDRAESERSEANVIMGFIPRSEVNRDRLRDEAVSLRGSVEDMKTFGETMKTIKGLDDPSDNDFVYVRGGRMFLNRVVLRK
jgi:uncharacterized protein YqeY